MRTWTRSSRCSGEDCVEVARAGRVVLVQDSKTPAASGGVMLAWSVPEWQEILRAVRIGIDHPAIDAGPDVCDDVVFGLERRGLLVFTGAEWEAFRAGAIKGEFEPQVLLRWREASPARGVAGEEWAGAAMSEPLAPVQAAAGAGGAGAVPPVPVAALVDPPAGRDLPREAVEGSLDAVATPGQPGSDSATAEVGGSVFADRSSVEATGTGITTPALVPVAAVVNVPAGRVLDHASDGGGCDRHSASGQPGPGADIVVRRVEPRWIVEQAPEWSRITLALIQMSDDRGLFMVGDRLYVGEDPAGNEVAYEVTGWDSEYQALIVHRVMPAADAEEWAKAVAPLVPPDGAS